jgi:hypothetical protein
VIEAAVLNDREMIHTNGMSTSTIVTMFATLHPTFAGVVVAISVAPPLLA